MSYFSTWTNAGINAKTAALVAGMSMDLFAMVVGDGKGLPQIPDGGQTKLANQTASFPFTQYGRFYQDPNNPNQLVFEITIPPDQGGYVIREIGIVDSHGVLLAVGNCPDNYKATTANGIPKALPITMTLAETLGLQQVVVESPTGIATNKNVADTMSAHVSAADPHNQYAHADSVAALAQRVAVLEQSKGSVSAIGSVAASDVEQCITDVAALKNKMSKLLAGIANNDIQSIHALSAAINSDPNFATSVANQFTQLNQQLAVLQQTGSSGLGIGQTWVCYYDFQQNIAVKALDQVCYNDTALPILVMIGIVGHPACTPRVIIDGRKTVQPVGSPGDAEVAFSFVVPAGLSYEISSESTNVTLHYLWELRGGAVTPPPTVR